MSGPKSGITRDELIEWGGESVFNQALAIVNSGDVVEADYNDDTLEIRGKIAQPSGWDMPTGLKLEPGGRVKSLCPCATNQRYGQICPHVVALGLAVSIKEMDEDEPRPGAGKADEEEADECVSPDGVRYMEVPAKPRIAAFVSGSRAALSVEMDARYSSGARGEREIEFPVGSTQADRTVYLPDPNDPYVWRVRSMDSERAAMKEIEKWGFKPGYQDGYLKYFTTDQNAILDFLGTGLPALRRLGWIVDLSDRLMSLLDKMPSILPVVTVKDAPGGAFDVRYDFDAMGKLISPVEIQAAVNRGDGYLLRDDGVFLLDTRAVEAMHAVFRDCATTQNGAPQGWFRVAAVHAPYVRSSLEAMDSFEVEDEGAPEWRRVAAERNRDGGDAKFEPVSLGKLDKVLRPYQKQGVYWMRFMEQSGMCGLLADEMGLGKTLQTLTWLSLPRADAPRGAKTQPALIVCPTSLVRNWEAEARKFAPWLKTLVVSGPDRAQAFPLMEGADIVVTSYALLQRDFADAYVGREFSAVVIDEEQHIKNRQTKNAQAVKLLRARRRLALTGTPVENSVSDVWSIFDFLMPEYLGDYETFKTGYEMPISDGGSAAEESLSRLKRKLHPFILRRLKQSVAKDLPPKIVKVSYCPMDDDTQREYTKVLAETRRDVGGMVREKGFAKSRFDILARLMKLRQIASMGKLEAFLEQVEDAISEGHRMLVFSQFVKMLQLIAAELQARGIEFCYLDGQTKDRLGECNRFNSNSKIPVFLISLMAGGTGLNLTGADMVVHYDPWWNPAVEDQATDRAHRIGQKRNVYVVKMIASGSIEEKVLELQRRKQAVIAATVSTTDAAVMEKLTAEDLAELLS